MLVLPTPGTPCRRMIIPCPMFLISVFIVKDEKRTFSSLQIRTVMRFYGVTAYMTLDQALVQRRKYEVFEIRLTFLNRLDKVDGE